MKIVLSVLILLLSHASYASESAKVNVIAKQSAEDVSHSYFISLLELAFSESTDLYPMRTLHILDQGNVTHGRSLRLLEEEITDVFWTGTNREVENKFLPIRIPLFKGLLGYRVSIVHKDLYESFSQADETQLKAMFACQGHHWPDSDILEANGFEVVRIARFDLMFKMVNQKRCDYFPRSIYEGYGELDVALKQYPDLRIVDSVILHYDFPIYFFVHRKNADLAAQISYGLNKALSKGKLVEMMQKKALTKDLFPLSKWQNSRFIMLENPYLPEKTPVNVPEKWLILHQQNSSTSQTKQVNNEQ